MSEVTRCGRGSVMADVGLVPGRVTLALLVHGAGIRCSVTKTQVACGDRARQECARSCVFVCCFPCHVSQT